jgi:hypothetical protein
MGGAEVAAVSDNTAAWANPAALGSLKGWELQLFGGFAAQNRNNLVGTIVTLATCRSTRSPTAAVPT